MTLKERIEKEREHNDRLALEIAKLPFFISFRDKVRIGGFPEELRRQKKESDERLASLRRQMQFGNDTGIASEPAAKLTKRKQKIWEVIQQGCKGRQYCREMDNAGVRVPRSWTNDGCPSTYLEAYDDLRWRQRIQDEKSKARRKALS